MVSMNSRGGVMAKFTEEQIEDIENIIDSMEYRVHNTMDSWYPTIEEVNQYVTGKGRSDVAFLMWLTSPELPLSPEQQKTKKEIFKLLYNSIVFTDAYT